MKWSFSKSARVTPLGDNHISQERNPIVGYVLSQGIKVSSAPKRYAAGDGNTKIVNHEHMFGNTKGVESSTAVYSAVGRLLFIPSLDRASAVCQQEPLL